MRRAWFTFYLGDYLADTGHLSMAHHGAYLMLMTHYYSTGRPIKANAKQLLFICKANGKQDESTVMEVLEEFFILRDGLYYHERIERELQKAAELSEKRRSAGLRGGRGRKANA